MKTVGIGLLGCGTVGKGILELLKANGDWIAQREGVRFEIRHVAVRTPESHPELSGLPVSSDPMAVVEDPACSLIAEVMGGEEPALSCLLRAFALGKPVATANKLVVSRHMPNLVSSASTQQVGLRFESTVCAGIPVVAALRDQLGANQFNRIEGIFNGTTNFILSQIQSGGNSFDSALAEAQRLGYAEADPSSDIDGFDAAYKLSILVSMATGSWLSPEHIRTKSIRDISPGTFLAASTIGCQVKCAARWTEGGRASVEPVFVLGTSPLYGVNGTENTVCMDGSPVGRLQWRGAGAGGGTTASGVVGDLIQLAKNPNLAEVCLSGNLLSNRHGPAPQDRQARFALVGCREECGDRETIERFMMPVGLIQAHQFRGGSIYLTERASLDLIRQRIAADVSGAIEDVFEVCS